MWNKGSITVFYSLILTLILSIISSFLLVAKVSAGRAQIAMAMDLAMYSEMAKYDPQLFEEFHVFFLDGGFGTGTLQLGKLLDELQTEISYGLSPSKDKGIYSAIDFIDLELEGSAITGYSLATDQKGSVFRTQAVQYMKNTAALQGISDLMEQALGEEYDSFGNLIQNSLPGTSYEVFDEDGDESSIWKKLTSLAESLSEEQLDALEPEALPRNEESGAGEQVLAIDKEKVREAKQVITEAAKLKKSSILYKLIKAPEEISAWSMDADTQVSKRRCQSGMGIVDMTNMDSSLMDKYFFQAYLLGHMNHFRKQIHTAGPNYGLEYMLAGKNSDAENLEAAAKKLLLIREAANTAYLYTDSEKRSSIETVSAMAAMMFGLPDLQPVLEASLILSWAYVESLVDVRGLFSGKCVPLWKSSSTWQVQMGDVPRAISDPDCCTKDNGTIGYEEYLSFMLWTVSEEKKTMRCLDVVEQTIRAMPEKGGFSMDCAIDMLAVQMKVRAEDKKTFEITQQIRYEKLR